MKSYGVPTVQMPPWKYFHIELFFFFNILLALTDHVFFVSMSTELQIIYQIQDKIYVKIMRT